MEFESTNSGTTAKLPILKLGEYEMWVIRIKQYFQIQDYALWEVIENGDSWVSVPQTNRRMVHLVTKMSIPVIAEEKDKIRKNDVKASTLSRISRASSADQTVVVTSTTEAEYVAAASCYGYSSMNGRICYIKCMFKESKASRYVKRGQDTKIPSLVVPLKKVGDKAIHKELGDRMERAATTTSSLEAEQDSGSVPRCHDTILGDVNAQTRFEIASTQSNDPPLLRGYTLRSGEDSMKLLELMEFFNAVRHMLMLPVQVPAAEESDGFAKIIDFLKASYVHYALTVNPIIYTSCIEQFFAIAKVQTVNGVRQLQALVDKKRVIITESIIRCDLHLEDVGGTDCLLTATIFEELARMGYEKPSQKLTFYKAFFSPQWKYFIHTITQCLSAKSTAWNEFSSTMASLIICLATNQKFNHPKYIFDAMVKHLDGGVKFLIKEAEVPQDKTEHKESVPTPSNDPQPSGEIHALNVLMVFSCIKLQARVLDLEKAKDAQAKEIVDLKKGSRSWKGDFNETQERQDDDLMFDTGVLDDDEVFVDVTTVEKEEQNTKTAKQKAKGIIFHDQEEQVIHIQNINGKELMKFQKLFDKEMKRVNTFVAMSSEAQESNEKKEEGSEEKAKGSRKKMLGRKRANNKNIQKIKKLEEDKETDEVEEVEEVEEDS
ncbi:hypothetical protein Tco_0256656 [Tanacetum coccineum]